jgi:hypothetical protein
MYHISELNMVDKEDKTLRISRVGGFHVYVNGKLIRGGLGIGEHRFPPVESDPKRRSGSGQNINITDEPSFRQFYQVPLSDFIDYPITQLAISDSGIKLGDFTIGFIIDFFQDNDFDALPVYLYSIGV